MNSSCYFKCIKMGDTCSISPPAAQRPAVATSLYQAQEVVGSAGSMLRHL